MVYCGVSVAAPWRSIGDGRLTATVEHMTENGCNRSWDCERHLHDFQDTSGLLDGVGTVDASTAGKVRTGVHSAMRLLSLDNKLSGGTPHSRKLWKDIEDRCHKSYPYLQAMSNVMAASDPKIARRVLSWAYDNYGPRHVDDRAKMAAGLRSLCSDVEVLDALARSCGAMTNEEVRRCAEAGERCCSVHIDMAAAARRIYESSRRIHHPGYNAGIRCGGSVWDLVSHDDYRTDSHYHDIEPISGFASHTLGRLGDESAAICRAVSDRRLFGLEAGPVISTSADCNRMRGIVEKIVVLFLNPADWEGP